MVLAPRWLSMDMLVPGVRGARRKHCGLARRLALKTEGQVCFCLSRHCDPLHTEEAQCLHLSTVKEDNWPCIASPTIGLEVWVWDKPNFVEIGRDFLKKWDNHLTGLKEVGLSERRVSFGKEGGEGNGLGMFVRGTLLSNMRVTLFTFFMCSHAP